MIDLVDAALGELIRGEALAGWDAEVVFDAPDREWSTRRTQPIVDAFLYDVKEDRDRRGPVRRDVRDDAGRVTRRDQPARYFILSYLISTWARRPEDEHRLLAQLINTLARYQLIPAQYLHGPLAELDEPVLLDLAIGSGNERTVSDIWSALGAQLHPALNLAVTVAFDPAVTLPMGPPVTHQPDLRAKRKPRASRVPRGVPAPVVRRPGAPDGSPTRDHIEEP